MNESTDPEENKAFTQLHSARERPCERKLYAEAGHSLEFYTRGTVDMKDAACQVELPWKARGLQY